MKDRIQSLQELFVASIIATQHHSYDIMNGGPGCSLFLYNLGIPYLKDVADKYIGNALRTVKYDYAPDISYAQGEIGFYVLLALLDKFGHIELDFDFVRPKVKSLYAYLPFFKRKYEFLYGLAGMLYLSIAYCMYRESVESFNEIVDKLYEENNLSGIFINDSKGNESVDISISHGITGLLAVLCKSQENPIYKSKKVEKIIHLIIDVILGHYCADYNLYGCCFPYKSGNLMSRSRLAWCYGDLSTAVTFWKAGKIYSRKDWQTLGLNVLKYNMSRKSFDETYINDPYLCHGTSGVAAIYYKMYSETKDSEFMDAANYWVQNTVNLVDRMFHNGTAAKYDSGLLTGLSGIGLLLNSYINNKIPEWTELLLF